MAPPAPTGRPAYDPVLVEIADYVLGDGVASEEARSTARWCLADSLGCAMLALSHPQCAKLIGAVVPGAVLKNGVRVPGTNLRLDPVQAAFCIGTLVRWLDFNDTWLAAEWGHPSDNLGALLACADYQSRRGSPIRMGDVLSAMIKAYEIQGVLSLANAFNRVGLDHVLLVRVASTAVAAQLLGADREQVLAALTHAWADGGCLRIYRHHPNAGSRKSWAAGDATSRAVRLALLTRAGATGCPSVLSAGQWGFQEALFRGEAITLARPLGCYVMENVLFKIAYPAEFHAQTAVEAAVALHPLIRDRLDEIEEIRIETQESAIRIIDKTGPLHNMADRDHCLQYVVAVSMIRGDLTADDYEDAAAADPRIDALRDKMVVVEEPRYSRDYLDPDQRSIANALQVRFTDGSQTDRLEVEYPMGHRRRRSEGLPRLEAKFRANLATRLAGRRCERIVKLIEDLERLSDMPACEFLDLFVKR